LEILYLIPGEGMPEEEIKQREVAANAFARSGTTISVEEVGKGPLSIESAIEEYMSIGPMLEAGDPGLRAVRELMDIPIIGPAESSYYFACMVAEKFSVISPMQAGVASADELVARIRGMGLESRMASVEFVETPVTEMWGDDPSVVIKQVTKAVKNAKDRGAGCAVLGCMSMAFQTMNTSWDAAGLPVINPLKVAIRTAESFVDQGVKHSRITYPAADVEKLMETVFRQ